MNPHDVALYGPSGPPVAGDAGPGTGKPFGTLAQELSLGRLLEGIEQSEPEQFASLHDLRTFLLELARPLHEATQVTPVGQVIVNDLDLAEMNEERAMFREYIGSLSLPDLARVAPLAYRRVLTEEEESSLRQRIEATWQVSPGMLSWFPDGARFPYPHVTFATHTFAEKVPLSRLHQMVLRIGGRRVFELREGGPGYEIDASLLVRRQSGYEHLWIPRSIDRFLAISHEGTVTLGGAPLTESIVDLWPAAPLHALR